MQAPHQNASQRLRRALEIHQAGDTAAAQEIYREVLAIDPTNVDALCLSGIVAQQRGQREIALDLLHKAIAIEPENPSIVRTLANTLRLLGEPSSAAIYYSQAVSLEPENLVSLFNYASVLQQLHRHDAAISCYRAILKVDSSLPAVHNDLASALIASQRFEEALISLDAALFLKPEYPEALNNLGVVFKMQGNPESALRYFLEAAELSPDFAQARYNVGTVYQDLKHDQLAIEWFRKALDGAPDHFAARHQLACTLHSAGRIDEAKANWEIAYRDRPVTIEYAQEPLMSVAVLFAAGPGNVPIASLFPSGQYTRIVCMLEYLTDDSLRRLPPHNLVFNAIGDEDAATPLGEAFARFSNFSDRPFFNLPQAVRNTRRDNIKTLFAGIANVVCAQTRRCTHDDVSVPRLSELEIHFPVIVRPTGSHGGEGMRKFDSFSQLTMAAALASGTYYVSEFINYISTDGYYRKYRMAFVNRKPYPYHLAISKHWKVHYVTAEMQSDQWKLQEELAFLRDPTEALGPAAIEALESIGEVLNLDIGGIDFTMLPDGRILVFEANATMLFHAEQRGSGLEHKNIHVQRIFDAFAKHVRGQLIHQAC